MLHCLFPRATRCDDLDIQLTSTVLEWWLHARLLSADVVVRRVYPTYGDKGHERRKEYLLSHSEGRDVFPCCKLH